MGRKEYHKKYYKRTKIKKKSKWALGYVDPEPSIDDPKKKEIEDRLMNLERHKNAVAKFIGIHI